MKNVSYCPKCGNRIDDEMVFCPKCGAALKATQPPTAPAPSNVVYRNEKEEKNEKHEKHEKGEKHEKRMHGFIGPLIGGLILVFIGLTAFLELTIKMSQEVVDALFFVVVGAVIIIWAVYGAALARRRHPKG